MFNPYFYNQFRKQYTGFYYTVQPQENLEMISNRYKVPVHNIIYANNLTYPYILTEGDRLFLPGINEPVSSGASAVHTVKYGENIDNIAYQYGVTSEELMVKNYLSNKDMLFVGQKLLIPDKVKSNDLNNAILNEASNNNDEIKVFPYSPYLPKPGTPEYNNLKTISGRQAVLKKGNKGSEVVKLQRLMSAIGYRLKRVDGYFGTEIESIVKDIQRKAHIKETGVVDTDVWEYVFAKVNNMPGSMG